MDVPTTRTHVVAKLRFVKVWMGHINVIQVHVTTNHVLGMQLVQLRAITNTFASVLGFIQIPTAVFVSFMHNFMFLCIRIWNVAKRIVIFCSFGTVKQINRNFYFSLDHRTVGDRRDFPYSFLHFYLLLVVKANRVSFLFKQLDHKFSLKKSKKLEKKEWDEKTCNLYRFWRRLNRKDGARNTKS